MIEIDYPTWVYHPKQDAKIVEASEAKRLYTRGWFDSPAFKPMAVVEPEKPVKPKR